MSMRNLGTIFVVAVIGTIGMGDVITAGSSRLVNAEIAMVRDHAPRGDAAVLGQRAAPAGSGLRIAYGREDYRGCPSLGVWKGSRRVRSIAPHAAGCSRADRRIAMFGRLYFEWFVERDVEGEGRRRRTDLWVTDGTRAGTRMLVTLRRGRAPGRDACESRWARAGGNAIAAAQWCWDPRRGTWQRGQVRIIIGYEVVRTLPIPRPWHFRMAGRRIVTTGADEWGRELWVHDGVMRRVDLRPGWRGSRPRQFEDLGGRVRFTADDGTGRATWISDGTIDGTYKVGR